MLQGLVKNGGAGGGASFGIHGGALEPLHNMTSKIVKCKTRPSTTIKNHCFWIKTHFLKLMERLLYDFLAILSIFGPLGGLQILAEIPKINDFWDYVHGDN